MNKPQLEKGQHNEPGIDFSKVKAFNFTPTYKGKVIPQSFTVDDVPKNHLNTKELDKMNRLKKILKNIWSYRWEVLFALFVIFNFADTVRCLIDKEYELAFAQGMFTFSFIVVIVQSNAIEKLEGLIKTKDETIKLQDELIARQSNWIERVKKIIEGNR